MEDISAIIDEIEQNDSKGMYLHDASQRQQCIGVSTILKKRFQDVCLSSLSAPPICPHKKYYAHVEPT
eukprot:6182392-Ditylum_brightwellii.AAC.1